MKCSTESTHTAADEVGGRGLLTSVFYIPDLHTPPNHLPDCFFSLTLMLWSLYVPCLAIRFLTQPNALINEPCSTLLYSAELFCVTQLNADRLMWFNIPLRPCPHFGDSCFY